MKAEDRQQAMLELLARRGDATIGDLSTRFEVSEMTVRRDLNQLAAAGLVVRTHGGAQSAASGSFEPPFALRARTNSEAKRSIAHAVAGQVRDGQAIVLDGGTTGLVVAEELVGRNITVCALNLRAADILSADAATRVFVPGGVIRTGESSIVGSDTEHALSQYCFDLYIMTASAVSKTVGFTEWNTDDAAVKRAALAASRHTLAAIDSAKFGHEAFARVCGLAQVTTIVTDDGLPTATRDELSGAADLLIS